jgi:hypothetical protein
MSVYRNKILIILGVFDPLWTLNQRQTLEEEIEQLMKEQGFDTTDDNLRIIAKEIVQSKYSPDEARIIIIAEKFISWIGKLSDSNGVETKHVGLGATYSFVPCESGGRYSVSVEKIGDYSYFLNPSTVIVQVWKEGEKLKEGSTAFVNDVVSLAGDCRQR